MKTENKKGMVYLVGAGPGDPGLITVKAVECIRRADVVVYDFLANAVFLKYASPEARRIYVGKKGSDHTLSQGGINKLIVELALSGQVVTRLKGGDPYVFGRGGEEAEELVQAGIAFEVVPGVSSAVAAPAYAGIPVTHRSHTSNVGFITGHEDPTKEQSSIDWNKIATGFGTLVFLMGVKNLPNISTNLIEAGRDPSTPAALIRWGTTSRQETISGTLENIAALAEEKKMKPPAVLVVGGVVGLRDQLNWFEKLPLFGRTILVTRTRAQAGRLTAGLTDLGARVIECPTISLFPPEDWAPVDKAIHDLSGFDWLVLTSPNGVEFLYHRLFHLGFDARVLAGLKIAAIGPATAEKLMEFGVKADLLPSRYVAEGLVEALLEQGVKDKKILLARAAEARDVLPRELSAAGAEVLVTPVYRTLQPDDLPLEALEALDNGEIDLVTFTSSSTAENMARLLGSRLEKFRAETPAAVIGPITGQTAGEHGFNIAAEALEYTIDGLVKAIVDYFSS